MTSVFLWAGVYIFLLMLLSLYRVVRGPLILDRILGGNVIGTKAMVLLLIIGVQYQQLGMFVDIAIAYAMLNFITTLGTTRLFFRKRSVQLESAPAAEAAPPKEA